MAEGGLKPALLLVAALVGPASLTAEPAIQWSRDILIPAVEVVGASRETLAALWSLEPADPAWPQVLAVFAEQGRSAAAAALPPIAGTWRVTDGHIRFEPLFPWTRGVRYRAEFRVAGAPPLVSFFEPPTASKTPTTSVARVFPSADVLPENQLKFYVEFSAPMSRGGVYERVHIRDARGKIVDLAFLELDEELWDQSMRRLTLLIDPGRIKRGVKPLEDIGPVFEVDETYALSVDDSCLDAEGRRLRASYEKKFRIGPPDRTPPDPARWKIRPPAAGTRAALVVEFDEPMDEALALRLISVAAPGKTAARVAGDSTLEAQERRWSFVPDQKWPRGTHRLAIATTIEDLAGNNIGKTFDVDLFEGVQRRVETQSVAVPFEVK